MKNLIIASMIGMFLIACNQKKREENLQDKYQVISPIVIDTTYTKEYVAEIQSLQNVELRSRVKGFIEKIYVDEGQAVKSGQILFSITSQEYKEDLQSANAQLKSALAEVKIAEVELNRVNTLVNKKIVSKTELELAQAKLDALKGKVDEAKSAISIAKLNLSFTQIHAPFNGIINRIPNKTGSLIDEGTLLTSISDNKEMYAYFNVSEKEYLAFVKQKELEGHKEATLRMADNQEHPYKGVIETVESEIDKNTGNLAFRARFPNSDLVLKHGASGKICINLPLKNVMIVPQKSAFEVQDKLCVYIVNDKNVVELKSFVSKLRLPHAYVVESGLSINDKIIFEGVQLAKEGEQVIPKPVEWNLSKLAL
jgi:membrane fusion protein (multidrug efflux system)